jgi:Arc/MetJ-type ribon-helix-helix transcriptional regulator
MILVPNKEEQQMPKLDMTLEKTPTGTRLPKWMADGVETAARRKRVSESDVIRWAIELWLDTEGFDTPAAENA